MDRKDDLTPEELATLKHIVNRAQLIGYPPEHIERLAAFGYVTQLLGGIGATDAGKWRILGPAILRRRREQADAAARRKKHKKTKKHS